MIPAIPLPDQLRERRETLGLSQAELAIALGFGPNGAKSVREWETAPPQDPDRIKPSPTAWAAFCYLGALASAYQVLPESKLQAGIRVLLLPSMR